MTYCFPSGLFLSIVRLDSEKPMESRIWLKTEDKRAHFLVLRGDEVHHLKVAGSLVTLKGKVKKVREALEAGGNPPDVGAKSVETLDVRRIGKAEVSPGNGSLTLHGEGDGAASFTFPTADNNADEILQTILAASGRPYQPSEEEIGVVEALTPPAIIGVVAGLFWMGIYQAAGKYAAGEEVVAEGRRRGAQQLLNAVAEALGVNGAILLGVALLVLVVGWAGNRIINRPKRAVWLPEPA